MDGDRRVLVRASSARGLRSGASSAASLRPASCGRKGVSWGALAVPQRPPECGSGLRLSGFLTPASSPPGELPRAAEGSAGGPGAVRVLPGARGGLSSRAGRCAGWRVLCPRVVTLPLLPPWSCCPSEEAGLARPSGAAHSGLVSAGPFLQQGLVPPSRPLLAGTADPPLGRRLCPGHPEHGLWRWLRWALAVRSADFKPRAACAPPDHLLSQEPQGCSGRSSCCSVIKGGQGPNPVQSRLELGTVNLPRLALSLAISVGGSVSCPLFWPPLLPESPAVPPYLNSFVSLPLPGGWQLPTLCPRPDGAGPRLDDRLWQDRATACPADPDAPAAMGGGEP